MDYFCRIHVLLLLTLLVVVVDASFRLFSSVDLDPSKLTRFYVLKFEPIALNFIYQYFTNYLLKFETLLRSILYNIEDIIFVNKTN